nr:Bm8215 [Brugia malayi]
MMFCDRCDRGYHTFCVGLSTPPNGNWICSSFCSDYNVTATDDSTCNE